MTQEQNPIYQWHGKPVKVKFGNCIVKENTEQALAWYNYECNLEHPKGLACIPCLLITSKGGNSFMIANHFGIGVYKLLKGGWPDCTHFCLTGKISDFPALKIIEFDEEEYVKHEAARERWFKQTYPVEHEQIERLKQAMKDHRRQYPAVFYPKTTES